MPVSLPLALPVPPNHPPSGSRHARTPAEGLGGRRDGRAADAARGGDAGASPRLCVAPNLPPRIKGAATHAAALSSHITHTTSTLHCDNGV